MQDAEEEPGNARRRKVLSPSGEWYRMRDQWCVYVLDYQGTYFDSAGRERPLLSLADKLVAQRLAKFINPVDKDFRVSQATIAGKLQVAEQTVKNAVQRLKVLGLIETERVREKGSMKLFNRYRLVPPWEAVPLLKDGDGRTSRSTSERTSRSTSYKNVRA